MRHARLDLVQLVPKLLEVVPLLPAGKDDKRAGGVALLAVVLRAGFEEVEGGNLACGASARNLRSARRGPWVARLGAVAVGGIVAHTFDGGAALGHRLRAKLQFLHFGCVDFGRIIAAGHLAKVAAKRVLLAFQLLRLEVEGIDEAPCDGLCARLKAGIAEQVKQGRHDRRAIVLRLDWLGHVEFLGVSAKLDDGKRADLAERLLKIGGRGRLRDALRDLGRAALAGVVVLGGVVGGVAVVAIGARGVVAAGFPTLAGCLGAGAGLLCEGFAQRGEAGKAGGGRTVRHGCKSFGRVVSA